MQSDTVIPQSVKRLCHRYVINFTTCAPDAFPLTEMLSLRQIVSLIIHHDGTSEEQKNAAQTSTRRRKIC